MQDSQKRQNLTVWRYALVSGFVVFIMEILFLEHVFDKEITSGNL